jgi:hypothetical protein
MCGICDISVGGMAQAVECLPSKCEVLSSNPSTEKKKKKYEKEKKKYLHWPRLLQTPTL